MDAFSNPKYRMVVGACGSQMGKTEIQFNILGHRFDDGPYVPALFIGATEKMVRSISKDRFQKMVNSTPALKRKLDKTKAGNNIMEKYFGGVRFGFAWAGSPTELASHPAGLVLVDEVDRMATDVGNEGDPILLARARTKNYSDSKIGVFSTPTIENQSAIWRHWESGTMGKWEWPCPECGEYFIPEFKLLWWPKDSTPGEIMRDARLNCPHCGTQIENRHKERMNQAGRYLYHVERGGEIEVAGNEPPDNPIASYWVSGLCSPWQSFGDVAVLMHESLRSKNQATIQSAINTYLGELYRDSGDSPDPNDLVKWIEPYKPYSKPEGVQLITMGVDVQKDGLYFVTWGWGFNSELWRLSAGWIPGETELDEVWQQLSIEMGREYGEGGYIDRVMVDSGFKPGGGNTPDHMVYKFCRQHYGKAFPAKGQASMDKSYKQNKIDITLSGKTLRGGLSLFHINTHYYKTFIYGRIRWPEEQADQPGRMHLDQTTDLDFMQQMTAEELMILPSGKPKWQLTGENHYLDCTVYAAAAASSLYVHNLQPLKGQQPEKAAKSAKKPEKFIPRPKKGWINR
jgi:phage terminase large subunit GpA-like protein